MAILGLSDRLFRDDRRVDVSFQICDEFLHLECILYDLAFTLVNLDSNLLHYVCYLLQIFNKVVVLCLKVFICLVNDVYKDLTIILKSSS